MKEVIISGHKVVMYDSIEDLPITRYHRFNKYMLIDAGIGSDLSSIDEHIGRAIAFMNANDTKSTVTELMNLRQSVYLLQGEVTPRHMAFAALIVSIDGKQRDDISETGLQATMELLKDVKESEVSKEVYGVKKKLESELSMYSPDLFTSTRAKEYYSKLREMAIMYCDDIIAGKDPADNQAIDKLDTELKLSIKPIRFEGDENAEIKSDKEFEFACLTIAQHLNTDAKKFTVLEYYNALMYIQDLAREQKKQSQRLKSRR